MAPFGANAISTKIDSIANNANTKTIYEMYLKLTNKTLEQRQWRRSAVFVIFNVEYASHIILVLLLLIWTNDFGIGTGTTGTLFTCTHLFYTLKLYLVL